MKNSKTLEKLLQSPHSNFQLPKLKKCHQVSLGSMSIIKHSKSKQIYSTKSALTKSNKKNVKLQTISWIQSHYQEDIDRLLENRKKIGQVFARPGQITKKEFSDAIKKLKIEQTFIDRIFWVFDENGNGKIDKKELMVGLEMLRGANFSEKLSAFFDICDEDGSGDIDEEELFSVLQFCVKGLNERKLLKKSLHELFNNIDENKNGVITKEEIIKAASQNEALKAIIENSVYNYSKNVHESMAPNEFTRNEIKGIRSHRNRQAVYSHFFADKLEKIVEEREKIRESSKCVQDENKKKLHLWRVRNCSMDFSFEEREKEVIYGADGKIIDY